MKERIAKYISIVGHPLLTLSIFAIVVLFNNEKPENAIFISMLFFGCILIPLVLNLYKGCQNGTYTNYDISDRLQRQNWYMFALSLVLFVSIVLFVTEQPEILRLNVLFAFLLLLTSKITNYFIKSSLHVSFNVFLAFLIIPFDLEIGLALMAFVILIAWSRLKLERHTFKEVAIGAFIGSVVGICWLLSIYENKIGSSISYSYNIGQ